LPNMSKSPSESISSVNFWDILRYVVVAVIVGVLIWFYFFYTPIVYDRKEHVGKTMGTDYIIKVARFPETGDWQKIAARIQDRLDTIDQMMSTYRQDSEVCRFNAFSSTEDWFPVSRETAYVVQTALEVSRLTEGAFDVTVAPLVQHWGFGANGNQQQTKSFEELKSEAVLLKEQTGYQQLSVRTESSALKKAIPELTIDLSAIAKGFAVDCVAELLDEYHITDYLIEIGGEVRGKGKKDKHKNKDWVVGIEKPILESSQELSNQFLGLQQKLALQDRSLATSGSYRQRLQIDGQWISHIINPRTGLPAQVGNNAYRLVAAAVIASDCTHADAWATAMFVLGEQQGKEIADRHGVVALFLLQNENEIIEVSSKNWVK